MQRIRTDISEREAYEAYLYHLRSRQQCGCHTVSWVVCPEGLRLHDEWVAAQVRERGEA